MSYHAPGGSHTYPGTGIEPGGHFMFRSHRIPITILATLALVLGLGACSDSTGPGDNGTGRTEIQSEGTIDPAAGSFVLKTLDIPPPDGSAPAPIQLIGSNLTMGPDGTVSVDVAVRNLHSAPLYAPAVVWLSRFAPAGVLPLNADWVIIPMDPHGASPIGHDEYGFDYAAAFGDDGRLEPEEISAPRTWTFGGHDGGSFSFAARAEFGLEPDLPRIAGLGWWDTNRNGVADVQEQPHPWGAVRVAFPGGEVFDVFAGDNGRFSVMVEDPGLYELRYDPLVDMIVEFSTPNPLQVLLTTGADGRVHSFLDADFGMYAPGTVDHVIQFTDLTPDSLQIGQYELLQASIKTAHLLLAEVAFSGCDQQETFSLFMSGGFMESMPIQADLVLRKDDQTDCEAYWINTAWFDLRPMMEAFLTAYGPGHLQLNLHDFEGNVTEILMEVWLEPSSSVP